MTFKDTKIIAVCGIDGSGKSSLVDLLQKDNILQNCKYVKKTYSQNTEIIKHYHKRKFFNDNDWAYGSFAHSMSICWTIDFLHHYKYNIEKFLGKCDYLVSDRYSLCFKAYALAVKCPVKIDNLLFNIKKPDLIIYIDAPLKTVMKRFIKRDEDRESESYLIMSKFKAAYKELLEKEKGKIIKIQNKGNIQDSYACFKKELLKLIR